MQLTVINFLSAYIASVLLWTSIYYCICCIHDVCDMMTLSSFSWYVSSSNTLVIMDPTNTNSNSCWVSSKLWYLCTMFYVMFYREQYTTRCAICSPGYQGFDKVLACTKLAQVKLLLSQGILIVRLILVTLLYLLVPKSSTALTILAHVILLLHQCGPNLIMTLGTFLCHLVHHNLIKNLARYAVHNSTSLAGLLYRCVCVLLPSAAAALDVNTVAGSYASSDMW